MKKQTVLNRLSDIRTKKCVSIETIAGALECTNNDYTQKESGIIEISTDEWILISKTLNVSVELFFMDFPDNLLKDYEDLLNGFKRLNSCGRKIVTTTIKVFLVAECAEYINKRKNIRTFKKTGNVIILENIKVSENSPET